MCNIETFADASIIKKAAAKCGMVLLSLRNPVGSILWANDDYCAMLGYTQKEFLNEIFCNGSKIAFCENGDKIGADILAQVKLKNQAEFELATLTRSGERIMQHIYGTVENDKDGIPVLRAVVFDITNNSKNLEASFISMSSFKTLFDNFPAGVFSYLVQSKGLVDYINPEMLKIIGCNRKQFSERYENHIDRILNKPYDDKIIIKNTPVVKPGDFELFNYTITTYDGKQKWLSAFRQLAVNNEGQLIAIAFVLDSDEKHQTDQKLIEANKELTQLSNNINGGIVRFKLNKNFEISIANQGFYKLFGLTKEEYFAPPVSGNFSHLLSHDSTNKLQACIAHSYTLGESCYQEIEATHHSGNTIWLSARGTVVDVQDGEYIIQAVFTDITELKSYQQRLEHAAVLQDSLLNAIPGGVLQFRLHDNKALSINNGFYSMLGYSEQEFKQIVNNESLSIVYPDDRAKVTSLATKQIASHSPLKLEMRIICKGGKIIWVRIDGNRMLDEFDQVVYQCIFTDISDIKHSQQQIEYEKERYIVLLNCVDEMVFEFDPVADEMTIFPKNKPGRHREMETKTIPNYRDFLLGDNNLVHPEDKALLDGLFAGESFSPVDVRMQHLEGPKGVYFWTEVRGTAIYNEDDRTAHIMGLMRDIDAQKRATEVLRYKSERDLLTQLYNKISATVTISDFLAKDGINCIHAMFVLDIDDFKSVNDRYGHQFGDSVLIEVGRVLRELFRTNDIIGRMGGDEFIVLMKDIVDPSIVAERAHELTHKFNSCTVEDNKEYKINASIGVALFPNNGQTFDALFEKADLALYEAKSKGKNRYAIYNNKITAICSHTNSSVQTMPMQTQVTDSFKIVNNLVDALYLANNSVADTINNFLQILGTTLDVSRAYLFDEKNNIWYEWCNLGIEPRHEADFVLTQDEHLNFMQFMDPSTHIIAFNNVKDLKRILPRFYKRLTNFGTYAILKHITTTEKFCITLGLDECDMPRLWTRVEQGLLSTAAKLITAFIIKEVENNDL